MDRVSEKGKYLLVIKLSNEELHFPKLFKGVVVDAYFFFKKNVLPEKMVGLVWLGGLVRLISIVYEITLFYAQQWCSVKIVTCNEKHNRNSFNN